MPTWNLTMVEFNPPSQLMTSIFNSPIELCIIDILIRDEIHTQSLLSLITNEEEDIEKMNNKNINR